MPQTTKTSTNSTKRTSKNPKSPLDDELGINEPYLNPNPDPTTILVRFEGKYYKYDADGNPYRFYPPGLKQPRSKTKSQL
ncbi:hypothetical protein GCM10028808_52720 [Spirosoma migulaei]